MRSVSYTHLECGSTGVTAERQKQVAFSYGFIYVKGQLLTRKDSGIAHFDDLKGKNVVTTAGTTNERYLKNYNAEHKLGMNVVSAKDHGEAFQMLQSGRAVAFYMDDALLYGCLLYTSRRANTGPKRNAGSR